MIRIGLGSIIGLAIAGGLLGILVIRAIRDSLTPAKGTDSEKGRDEGSIFRF